MMIYNHTNNCNLRNNNLLKLQDKTLWKYFTFYHKKNNEILDFKEYYIIIFPKKNFGE